MNAGDQGSLGVILDSAALRTQIYYSGLKAHCGSQKDLLEAFKETLIYFS